MNATPVDHAVYLTSEEAADRLRFTVTAPSDPTRHFLRWAKREGLRPARRGRVLLWDPRYLDAFIARAR
jgi:hypothetical protein